MSDSIGRASNSLAETGHRPPWNVIEIEQALRHLKVALRRHRGGEAEAFDALETAVAAARSRLLPD